MALNAMMASLSLGAGAQQPVTLRRFEGFIAAGAAHHVPLVAARSRQAAAQRVPLRIWAARIGGVEIPNKKRIEFSLQYVYGIGHTTAKAILLETGVENKRTFELSEEELSSIRDEVEKYSIEGDLRRFNSLNIKRLKDIQCYRGRRHIMNLPCHGQRTKTNARTRKGKARTVPNKKK